MRIRRRGVRFQENGRGWRLPGHLYTDDLVLCDESKENLRAVVGRLVEMLKRRGLKVNVGKCKGLECEV